MFAKGKLTVITGFFIVASLCISLQGAAAYAVGKPTPVPQQGNGPANGHGAQGNAGQGTAQDARLKACQARESAIKTRSTHLTDLASTMETKFDAIAGRVEQYYTTKVVSAGMTVSNYSTLVADIQTQKNAVQTALAAAQADATSFNCTSNDPKAQLTQFRQDMLAVIKALKDYRISIKDLIVGVHSVVGQSNRATAAAHS